MTLTRYLAILLVFLPAGVIGQKFFYTVYRTTDGLPTERIRATLQDSSGFIWIATDDGLARFDGKFFRTYDRLLESQYTKALIPEGPNTLLLANDSGIFRLWPRKDTLYAELLLSGHPLPSDTALHYPNNLFLDRKGRLWISQPDARVACWEKDQLRFFTFDRDHTTGYSDSGFSFAEDRYGTLWLAATTGQLFAYQEEEAAFRAVRFPRSLNRVNDLKVNQDTLWIAGDGLYRTLTRPDQSLHNTRFYDLREYTASCLTLDTASHSLYIGTQSGGLFRLHFQGHKTVIQRVFGSNDPHRVEELPFRHIHHIYRDREGALWLSTLEGLGRLQVRFFESVFGLANNNTFTIAPYGEQGVLLSFGDVYAIDREGTEFFGQLLPELDRRFITAIAPIGSDIWMGTTNGELFCYQQNRVTTTIDLSDRGAGIFYLAPDHYGSLWISQAPSDKPIVGVARRLADGRLRYYAEAEGLTNRILVVAESSRGQIYAAGIGPETYLYRYRETDDDFINLSLPLPFAYSQNFEVHDLTIDDLGVVWLGTTDGLLRYDLERIQRIDLGPLTTTEIRSVTTGENGSVWLSTDTQGLIYYRNGHYVLLTEESGLPTKITAYRCLTRDREGRIWVGTAEGTVHSHDLFPQPEPTVSPVVLSVKVNNQPVPFGGVLPELPSKATLAVEYRALAYPGRGIEYQYRLAGSPDSTWSIPDPQSDLAFSNLTHGDYQLEIRALRPGGYDWSAPMVLPFHVNKEWYQRWWAVTLFILGGAIALFYLIQFNIGRLIRRIRRLEKALAAQDREIREKEDLLAQQSRELAARARDLREATTELTQQQQEIQVAMDNLQLLHRLIERIPRNSDWETVLRAIAEVLKDTPVIQAFEFGYYDHDALQLQGYSWRIDGFLHREVEFSEKDNLAVRALVHKEPLLINDFRQEHEKYIEQTDNYRFNSMMFLPFELPGRQQLVLCVYGLRKQAFHKYDQMMLQIFVDYLAMAVKGKL